MTNHPAKYIWEEMPLAIALQYQAIWWKQYNNKRQMSALDRIPEILIVEPYDATLRNQAIV